MAEYNARRDFIQCCFVLLFAILVFTGIWIETP